MNQFKEKEELLIEKKKKYEIEKRVLTEKTRVFNEKLLPELYQFTKSVYSKNDYSRKLIKL